ncbi:MAG: hypothetical protein IPM31_13785 [Anaerolineae bacterium]|nr:hypothetical protein [Anaerolineae bacterium]MCC7190902.1 hypothetical protein [Anaerolineales bacterium]
MNNAISVEHILSLLFNYQDSILGSSIKGLARPFDISPNAFLKFAESDLQSELSHKAVNALSNTKRAIDCQIECILATTGINLPDIDFPEKLNILNEIGLLSPILLQKINRERNLLEHEFVNPPSEKVADALDIATLFISYTNAKMQKFRDEILFDTGIIGINVFDGYIQIRVDSNENSIILEHPNQHYYSAMKWLIQVSNEWW